MLLNSHDGIIGDDRIREAGTYNANVSGEEGSLNVTFQRLVLAGPFSYAEIVIVEHGHSILILLHLCQYCVVCGDTLLPGMSCTFAMFSPTSIRYMYSARRAVLVFWKSLALCHCDSTGV